MLCRSLHAAIPEVGKWTVVAAVCLISKTTYPCFSRHFVTTSSRSLTLHKRTTQEIFGQRRLQTSDPAGTFCNDLETTPQRKGLALLPKNFFYLWKVFYKKLAPRHRVFASEMFQWQSMRRLWSMCNHVVGVPKNGRCQQLFFKSSMALSHLLAPRNLFFC